MRRQITRRAFLLVILSLSVKLAAFLVFLWAIDFEAPALVKSLGTTLLMLSAFTEPVLLNLNWWVTLGILGVTFAVISKGNRAGNRPQNPAT